MGLRLIKMENVAEDNVHCNSSEGDLHPNPFHGRALLGLVLWSASEFFMHV